MEMTAVNRLIRMGTELGCAVLENEPMARRTTFRIGGPARLLMEVHTSEALAKLYGTCKSEGIPCFVLGNGSNLLVDDEGYDGVVLHLGAGFANITREGDDVIAGAGAKLTTLANFARNNGLAGLEFSFGIPGSVGGAAYMNAGAYGGEMKDVLVSCEVVTAQGEVKTLTAAEMDLSYRHSALMKNESIVTSIRVHLQPDDKEAITARMNDYMGRRKDKQPLEYPSAGSTFKRPVGYFAGALIQQCGLKGYSVGGAQVSEKHAGFVINKGNATAKDVRDLIAHVQKTVKEETGVTLECEVLRLGAGTWEK